MKGTAFKRELTKLIKSKDEAISSIGQPLQTKSCSANCAPILKTKISSSNKLKKNENKAVNKMPFKITKIEHNVIDPVIRSEEQENNIYVSPLINIRPIYNYYSNPLPQYYVPPYNSFWNTFYFTNPLVPYDFIQRGFM